MRLAVVTNDYPPKPGGIQQYLGSLVDAWPHEVRVLAPADEPAAETARGEAVVRRHTARFMWPTPGVGRWVERELAAFEPDAILFGAPYPLAQLARSVKAAIGVPVGVLGHGAEVVIPAATPVVRSILRSTLVSADVRFAVSRFTQRRLESLTAKPVRYIGAGVDGELFRPANTRSAPRAIPPLPVLGCVSRFVPRKGPDRVLHAAARLAEMGKPVRVLLVGKGRTERSLRRLADRLGVETEFAVDVPWAQLPGRYASMDVFCMPCRSRWGGLEIEGLGLVFLEAAACGLPVLAGNSGGSPETVDPGRTGFVVQSVDDIVEGVEIILSNPERAAEMGRLGRERVVDRFSWASVAERLEEGFLRREM